MKKAVLFLLTLAIAISCAGNHSTGKRQSRRNEISDVHDFVHEIDTKDVLIGRIARTHIIDNYLLITDFEAPLHMLHVFDKRNFEHIVSCIRRGRGPGEIAGMGIPAIDAAQRKFLLPDYGKYLLLEYDIDELLADPDGYMPNTKLNLAKKRFPSRLKYLNDSIYIGEVIAPTGNSGFNQSLAKWNINTGECIPLPYEHPKIQQKRTLFALSVEHGVYVETYQRYDLLTICDLDGNLKWNIYGPEWNESIDAKTPHSFNKPCFCNGKIIAAYSGGDRQKTILHVFDLQGDYLKTLDVGYKISDYCYDKQNNRLIMALNDVIQFAYLDLDGII